jgi:hypothetical protein
VLLDFIATAMNAPNPTQRLALYLDRSKATLTALAKEAQEQLDITPCERATTLNDTIQYTWDVVEALDRALEVLNTGVNGRRTDYTREEALATSREIEKVVCRARETLVGVMNGLDV